MSGISDNNSTAVIDDYIATFSSDAYITVLTTITKVSLTTSGATSPLNYALTSNLTTVYIVMSVVGVVGNLLCIVVLLGHAPLRRKPANYFLISQSIIDVLVSFLLPINLGVAIPPQISRPFDVILCYLWTSRPIFLGLFTASLFNIVALTVERYFKTVHPVQHRIWMTKKRLVWIVVGVSIAGFLLKVPYAVGGTSMNENRDCLVQTYPTETIAVVVGMYNFLVEYFLPLLTIAFCYIQMARSLRQGIRPTPVSAAQPAPPASAAVSSREAVMAKARRNILKTLLVVVVIFVVCTTFKQTLLLAKVIGKVELDYTGIPFNVSQVMAFMVCCTNPFIYFVHYKAFKEGLRAMFTRRRFNSIRPGNNMGQTKIEATMDEGTL